MSFSSTAKEELLRQPLTKACCMLAELGALTQTSATLSLAGGGNIRVSYRADSAGLARRIFVLLKERLDVTPSVSYVRHTRLGGQRTSVLTLETEDTRRLLAALGMLETDGESSVRLRHTTPRLSLTRQCCRRSFLRAAFLGCGTMSAPESSYHLEWAADDDSFRQTLTRILEKSGFAPREYVRRDKHVLYLKESQRISDVLAMMGAANAMLKLENIRIQKQLRGAANRAGNCDEHNFERQLNASEQQAEAIRVIALRRGLSSLTPALAQTARLRLEHTEMSLADLGQMSEPAVSKSAVSHRMDRLMAIAAQIRAEDGLTGGTEIPSATEGDMP